MSNANSALRITELDFDGIKTNLKNYMRSQSEFQDFDFEGSGMSVLLDVLAYNTHYMGYYLNMLANESFLDTAQLRASAISHAKLINYVPSSRHGATAKINVTITPSVNESSNNVATILKYSRLYGADIDGINYSFYTVNTNTAPKIDGTITFNELEIKQGEPITLQYRVTPENTKRRFDIPSANVDTDTISVFVQESASNTYSEEYTLVQDITEINSESRVYFIEENIDQNYTIYFGDNILGKTPKNDSIVNLTFVDTVGSAARNISEFTFSGAAAGSYTDDVTIVATGPSSGGTDKETIDQIKFNAPYFYTAQNRAVTKFDYESLLIKDYPNIESISVWGGEDNVPPVYGKVYLSIKTRGNSKLSNLDKEVIKDDLIKNRNVVTVIPEIIDPDFTYLLLSGRVFYNPNITALSANEIKQFVRNAILDYEAKELNKFESVFRKSKLQNLIETSENSITGSDIRVYIQKQLTLDPLNKRKYSISTNFPIKKGDFNNRIYTYPQIRVADGNGIIREIFYEEIPSSFTGVDKVDVVNPGFNFSSVPTITIVGDGTGATAVAKVSGGRISSIEVTNKGINYSRATAVITGGDGSGAVVLPKLESKFGKLRTYYNKANGEKVIIDNNAGDVNYETGLIELSSIRVLGTVDNDFYENNVIAFNIPIEREIITPLRNRIVVIDEGNPLSIQIEVVPE